MSGDDTMKSLAAEARTTLDVIRRIEDYYDDYTGSSLNRAEPSRESRIVLAEIFGNYYTALETFFLRVSQTFENNLSPARWHAELLNKMVLEIDGIRPRVVSATTRDALRELMRFRHFKRYYLEFDYDWDKLAFLEKKFVTVRAAIHDEITQFIRLLTL